MAGYWQLYGIVIRICTHDVICKYPYFLLRNLSLFAFDIGRRFHQDIRKVYNNQIIR